MPGARPATAVSTTGANRPAARDIVHIWSSRDSLNNVVNCPLFTVPAGRILVVTGLSAHDANPASAMPNGQVAGGIGLEIDGVVQGHYDLSIGEDVMNLGISFGVGIPLTEGQTVRVLTPAYQGLNQVRSFNLHGYMEDA